MSAYGKVVVGFSAPFVGLYNKNGTNVSYTNGMRLARGVEVSLKPETSDDNEFYADGVLAESDGGKFKRGTVSLVVDGLHDVAERFVFGLPEQVEMPVDGEKKVKVTKYGDKAKIPYVGVGFVVWYQSDGVVTYQPMILPKTKFITHGNDAKTKEDQKNWQTQSLEASIHRDDTPDHDWKWLIEEQATEEEAIAILKALLSVADEADPVEPAAAGDEPAGEEVTDG